MTLNFNLGLFLITQNHVFPSSWPVWVESLYFDLHYKYMFYNNCYTCALYIVHHYDISYLTPFVFLFHKKGWIKPISSPPAPPLLLQLSPFKALTAMSFGIPGFPFSFGCRHSNRWAGSEVSREEMCQPAWGKPLQRMASSTVQEAVGSRYVYIYMYLYIYISPGCRRPSLGGSRVHSDASAWHIGPAAPLQVTEICLWLLQGPSGCWGLCKDWQDQTLGFCKFTLKLPLKNRERNVGVPWVLLSLHVFIL